MTDRTSPVSAQNEQVTEDLIDARIRKYSRDIESHPAPSQPDGICRCGECSISRAILVELGYMKMAHRNLAARARPGYAQCLDLEPVAYQFRQRSAVGKGPQNSLPWCDWVCIEREDYERYAREPNKLVQVRPLYTASPDTSTDRTSK